MLVINYIYTVIVSFNFLIPSVVKIPKVKSKVKTIIIVNCYLIFMKLLFSIN